VVVGILALAVLLVLVAHPLIPNVGGWASLIETFLPWSAVIIGALVIAALVRRSWFSALSVAAAVAAWLILFLPLALPHPASGAPTMTIVSENIDAGNHDPLATVQSIEARHPTVIALQELDEDSRPIVEKALAADYPHSYVVGTVGVWSTLPLSNAEPLSLGLSWKRALSVDVAAPEGAVRLYAVHMASVRIGEYAQRDEMLDALKSTIAADTSPRLVVVGDFNSASTDRSFSQLDGVADESPTTSGGFGFTWPAGFPVARLDHALVRGMTTETSTVLPANGSDHRGIAVGLN
jgi:vancomycin resistance protein VanJ